MEKRESLNSKWGFILACIGSAVGMGNLWMFPTRVSLYGGGSFLIPYFIFVALIGSTGVIGEMCLGRGTRSGPIDAFGAACEKMCIRDSSRTRSWAFSVLAVVLHGSKSRNRFPKNSGWKFPQNSGNSPFRISTTSPRNADGDGPALRICSICNGALLHRKKARTSLLRSVWTRAGFLLRS